MSRSPSVLVCLTGSIACYKACTVVSRLAQAGVEVSVAATPAALRFVGTATLEGLSGRPVFSDLFAEGRALDHIGLARRADLALVCPATANTVNRLAAGLGDDVVGALFLAWGSLAAKPWWIAPAMNGEMWGHPATRDSVRRLAGWGVRFVDPDPGPHACGEDGPGRLADPERIVAEVLKALRSEGRP